MDECDGRDKEIRVGVFTGCAQRRGSRVEESQGRFLVFAQAVYDAHFEFLYKIYPRIKSRLSERPFA
jgi:hypothetical protein